MRNLGISVQLPDINKSGFTFVPDTEHRTIIYGLKGITKINAEFANTIIDERPYASVEDFVSKTGATKVQTINLIKCGAFDNLYTIPRESILRAYIESVADTKNKLTLANIPTLIRYNVCPENQTPFLIFNFIKYLRKNCVEGANYFLDEYSLEFYGNHFDPDWVTFDDNGRALVDSKRLDKAYKAAMDPIRPWLNDPATLQKLNNEITNALWDKYCHGNRAKWEMDSVGYYDGAHELDGIDLGRPIVNYFDLSEEPKISHSFSSKDGKEITLYELSSIAGTVIERNKLKSTVTLLTQYGVVKVRVYKSQFAKFDRQSFVKDEETGKKTITERSWFTRGNKLLLQGIRRGDFFVPKSYRSSPFTPITLIEDIDYDEGYAILRTERYD